MAKFLTARSANTAGFLVCCGLIAYALYAQYVLYLEPCPLCLFQRFAIIGLGIVFLLTALQNPEKVGGRIYAFLIFLAAASGIAIATRHLWIQSLPEGSVPSCGASLGYLFDIMSFTDVIAKVFSGSGECAKVDILLGLSWPWWVILAMVILGAAGIATNLLLPNRQAR